MARKCDELSNVRTHVRMIARNLLCDTILRRHIKVGLFGWD